MSEEKLENEISTRIYKVFPFVKVEIDETRNVLNVYETYFHKSYALLRVRFFWNGEKHRFCVKCVIGETEIDRDIEFIVNNILNRILNIMTVDKKDDD